MDCRLRGRSHLREARRALLRVACAMPRASACGSSWLSVESRRVALATIATPSRADAPRRRPSRADALGKFGLYTPRGALAREKHYKAVRRTPTDATVYLDIVCTIYQSRNPQRDRTAHIYVCLVPDVYSSLHGAPRRRIDMSSRRFTSGAAPHPQRSPTPQTRSRTASRHRHTVWSESWVSDAAHSLVSPGSA